jgi:hypothetical protein
MTLQDHQDSINGSALPDQPTVPAIETTPAPRLTHSAALLVYRDALVAAASTTGLVAVELKYSGANDEGRTEEICSEPEGASLDDVFIEAWACEPRWQPGGEFHFVKVPARRSISDVLEEMSDLALAVCGHGGYDSGDGGYGVLRLDLRTGMLTLEHHDYYLESVKSFHDLSDVVNDEPANDMPALDENGIPERKISFGCCGGCGDDC